MFVLIRTYVLLVRNWIFDQNRIPENLESLHIETFCCKNPSPKPVPGSMFANWRIFRWAPQIMSDLAAWQSCNLTKNWKYGTLLCVASVVMRCARFVSFQTRMAPWHLPLLPQSAWHLGWNYSVVHFLELSWKKVQPNKIRTRVWFLELEFSRYWHTVILNSPITPELSKIMNLGCFL